MKIGVITPTTGTRPSLLSRNTLYMSRQNRITDERIVLYDDLNLTAKYKKGILELREKVDLIFFCEDDDYYSPDYFKKMMKEYEYAGNPEVFGIGETYFYHPELNAVWYQRNEIPCTFQMCLRSDAVDKIDWSLVNPLIMDVGIWRQLEGKTVIFEKPLSIGVKHGRGVCGAGGHNKWFYDDKIKLNSETEWAKYDPDWLRDMIGSDAEWYEWFAANRDVK